MVKVGGKCQINLFCLPIFSFLQDDGGRRAGVTESS